MTDSNSELPLSLAKKHHVPFVPMPYSLDDVEYAYDLGETTDFKRFFNSMRGGSLPTTSTYPPQYYVDFCRPTLEAGQDILFLSFSSRLSSAYEYLTAAVAQLREEYSDRRVETLDTLSISGSMALLVYRALVMREQGAPMDEIIGWVNANKLRANSYFTVNDLNHLKRGGRVSATAAMVGTMLSVKPILLINREGRLIPTDKVMGRKKALRYLAEMTLERAERPEENACLILHADCEEDALALRAMVEQGGVHFGEWIIQMIGPVIGSHTGPDTVGLCFFGRERD